MSSGSAAPIKEKQVAPRDVSIDSPIEEKRVRPGEADNEVVGETGPDPSQGIPPGEELSLFDTVKQICKRLEIDEIDTDSWSWPLHQNSYRCSGEFVTSF